MNIRKAVIIKLIYVFILIFSSTAVFAEKWPEVYDRIKKKYDQVDRTMQDITIIQNTQVMGPEGSMNSDIKLYKKGKKFRVEMGTSLSGLSMSMEDIRTVIVGDGQNIWLVSPFTGKKNITEGEGINYYSENEWWQSITNKARITGSEQVEGRDCYIIELPSNSITQFGKIWVDKNSLVLIKGESAGFSSGGGSILISQSDFKKITGDFEWPYKTQTYIDGELVSVSEVKSVSVNSGLSDTFFDVDKVEQTDYDYEGIGVSTSAE